MVNIPSSRGTSLEVSRRIEKVFGEDMEWSCRTLQMSHDGSWHDLWLCTDRDSCRRWLWRLVGLFFRFEYHFVLQSLAQSRDPTEMPAIASIHPNLRSILKDVDEDAPTASGLAIAMPENRFNL